MAEIFKSYSALSPSSPRSDVQSILQSIIDLSPSLMISSSTRTDLIQSILEDLKVVHGNGPKRLTSKDASQALLAVKYLGKHSSGSEFLSSTTNLSNLLALSSTFQDNPEASGEALRCIANALLLIEPARSTFIEKEVDGGHIALSMLEKTSSPDRIFILSRILFLCTASGPPFVRTLIEEKRQGHTIVEIIGAKLDTLTVAILAGTKMAREAMSDLLKLTFNLLVHYPKMVECEPQTNEGLSENERKVMGDFWSSRLDGVLPPLLRTFSSLPPTFPGPISAPLTHVIHSLITIPISPNLRSIWLSVNLASPRHSTSNSRSASRTPQLGETSKSSSRSNSPTRTTQTQASSVLPKLSTLDRALSVIAAGRKSLSRPPLPNALPIDVLQRAFDLLEVSFSHYFPEDADPDGQDVRDRCKQETGDSSLDDVLSPLVVLISRLCIADELSRGRTRQWIVPDDLDRSKPLEGRSDILGRCLRLLGCVHHPRLKDAVGEMLFAMSDSDATTLCALVGYGNVAGFLFNRGIFNPRPALATGGSNASLSTPSGTPINPITGTTVQKTDIPEMSDEEKEREMEKLFVLFDRLERTGAIPPSQNPMRKAVQQATFGGSSD